MAGPSGSLFLGLFRPGSFYATTTTTISLTSLAPLLFCSNFSDTEDHRWGMAVWHKEDKGGCNALCPSHLHPPTLCSVGLGNPSCSLAPPPRHPPQSQPESFISFLCVPSNLFVFCSWSSWLFSTSSSAQSSPRFARESWGLRSSHCRAEETSPGWPQLRSRLPFGPRSQASLQKAQGPGLCKLPKPPALSRELRASALCPGLEARFPARRREERGCGPVTGNIDFLEGQRLDL